MRRAVTLWREAAADGTNIATQTYNSLLYLAAGGEGWERLARGIDEGIRPLPPQPVRPRFQQKGKGEQQQQQQGEASEAGSSGVQASGATASVSGPVATAAAAGGGGEVAAAADVEGAGAAPVPAPEQPPMVPCAELMACGEEIWAAMQASRAVPDHGTFLALARMAAIRGDAEQALHWVRCDAFMCGHACMRSQHAMASER